MKIYWRRKLTPNEKGNNSMKNYCETQIALN